jgi:hypothetical protein
MIKAIIPALVGVFLILQVGCIMPASNVAVSPYAKLSSIKTIAVWKFEDGGQVANSGNIATRAIESEFMLKIIG